MEQLQFATGGHPFDIDDLVFLQSGMIEALKGICTGLAPNVNVVILSGCVVIITPSTPPSYTVSEGFIYYSGEIFYVPSHSISGTGATYWTIVGTPPLTPGVTTIPDEVSYEDGGTHYVHIIRQIQLTLTTGTILTSLAPRLKQVVGTVPQMGVINYCGSTVNFDLTGLGLPYGPVDGYALCNGQNGTPNLQGKFIVGLNQDLSDPDYHTIGVTGGLKGVTLTKAQIPRHIHTKTSDSHSHTYAVSSGGSSGATVALNANDYSGGSHHDVGTSSEASGVIIDDGKIDGVGGELSVHENRPPYYTLAMIMKL